ncbi:MAG: peptidoglycan editing factor PgeF [Asticcacaulis sp.]
MTTSATALPAPLTHPLLDLDGISHGFFTRKGGVSEGIYASLNVGRGSRDNPDHVSENRRRVALHFGQQPESLLSCFQIHSAICVRADEPWGKQSPDADAVATRIPGLICGALSADCTPILFADPEARVVASAHAGWAGALAGIAESTLNEMIALGAAKNRIRAVVGPCIHQPSYEVGPEFRDRFLAVDTESARFFITAQTAAEGGDKFLFDLPGYVLFRLERAGLSLIATLGRDTFAEDDLFFSNRRAFKRQETDYGRLISAITLTR